MVEIKKLCAGYDGKEILHEIDLSFEPGKVTVIVGPNGCGKSTLLKALVGLVPVDSGEITIDGVSVKTMDSSKTARKIAYLPQSKKTPDISVLRMVLHGRFPYLSYPRRYKKEDYEIASKALRSMGIEEMKDCSMKKLSGGTRQKVYIAMALAQDTPTILMDEPTVYLDISHQMKLMETAKELAASGKAVVMVLHDLSQAFKVADRMIVMSGGSLVKAGSPEKIYESRIVDEVFGMSFHRVLTRTGWQYYYRTANDK